MAGRKQGLAKPIQASDLAEDRLKRRLLALDGLAERILGLEAHRADRIADFVSNTCRDPAKSCQSVRLGELAGEIIGMFAGHAEPVGEQIERVDHAVEIGLARPFKPWELFNR